MLKPFVCRVSGYKARKKYPVFRIIIPSHIAGFLGLELKDLLVGEIRDGVLLLQPLEKALERVKEETKKTGSFKTEN